MIVTVAALALATWVGATGAAVAPGGCAHWVRPAVAADPRPGALRVFVIQFEQHPAQMRSAADYTRAIDCALRIEVVPHLARRRPDLVVFDEDVGLQALAIGPRRAGVRALLRSGIPSC